MRFRFKSFIILTITTVFPILFLGLFAFFANTNRIVSILIENRERSLTTLNDALIKRQLEDMETIVRAQISRGNLPSMFNDPEVFNAVVEDWNRYLELFPLRPWIYYGDEQGRIHVTPAWTPDEDFDPRTRPWYRNALSTDGVAWTEPYGEYLSGDLMITASMKVVTEDGLAGVMAVDSTLDALLSLYTRNLGDYEGINLLVDQEGFVLSGPKVRLETDRITMPAESDETTRTHRIELDGRSYYAAMVPIDRTGVQIVSLIEVRDMLEGLQNHGYAFFGILSLAILVAILAARSLSSYVTRSINTLNTYMGRLSSGRLTTEVCTPTDDEFRQLNYALNRMTARLIQSLREKRTLQQLLTHSVGNSMATMSQRIIDLLASKTLSETERDLLKSIERDLHGMQLFITNTAMGSSEDLRSYVGDDDRADLEDILTVLRGRLLYRSSQKGQNILLYNPLGRAEVAGNEDMILHALENILDNAIKYSPLESTVTIAVSQEDTKVHVDISDEGPGIPENEVPLLFQEGARLSTKPTAGERSHRIGLAVTKKTLERMGGSIAYRGKGADAGFRVTLSLAQEPGKDSES